jgi:hypothetical protein
LTGYNLGRTPPSCESKVGTFFAACESPCLSPAVPARLAFSGRSVRDSPSGTRRRGRAVLDDVKGRHTRRRAAPGRRVLGYGTFRFACRIQLHRPRVPGGWLDPVNLDCTTWNDLQEFVAVALPVAQSSPGDSVSLRYENRWFVLFRSLRRAASTARRESRRSQRANPERQQDVGAPRRARPPGRADSISPELPNGHSPSSWEVGLTVDKGKVFPHNGSVVSGGKMAFR